MYYNVIFISYLPLSKEFEVPESVRDVAMDGVADYYSGN